MSMFCEQGKKTTTWQEDAVLAKTIAKKMTELYYDADAYRAMMKQYVAKNVTCLTFPPFPARDGYGSSDIWLDIEYATRVGKKDKVKKKEYVSHGKTYSVGPAIVMDEYRAYANPDGTVHEVNVLVVYPVYNGEIIGYMVWRDPYPERIENEKESLFNELLKNMPNAVLDTTDYPYLSE